MVRFFTDSFLFAHDGEPSANYFCNANDPAYDDLADLADMIGAGATLDDPTKQSGDNSDASYDLESELAENAALSSLISHRKSRWLRTIRAFQGSHPTKTNRPMSKTGVG